MSKVSSQFKACHFRDEFPDIKREIHPGYQFSCLKGINDGVNPFLVYRTLNGQVDKIFHEASFDDTCVDAFVQLIANESVITDKLLVAGAHTVVNLKDRLEIGKEPIVSLDFSLKAIDKINQQIGIEADFMIPLNDFFMEHDPSTTSDQADNKYRQDAVSEYILPTQAEEMFKAHARQSGRSIQPFYCSEKGMADRFNRHIKNKKKDSELFVSSDSGANWYMRIEDQFIPVIENNKPNCVAGNAATERATRYHITPNKQFDHYTSRIGIYPRCSMNNVLNGYRVACKTYDHFDMPGYFVFFGGSCA